ncbi:MAG: metal-dependent hydrolase [Candidatus Pacearchaeota archaeon]|jgi:membrane-bound metal-dependent hydrolase YbcI (DUF457 family)
MQWKTHLAIGLAVALFFAPHVTEPLLFIPIVLVSSLFPDVDSGFSYIGKNPLAKPIQMTTDHRGIVHSYTFCVAISILIAFLLPIVALPFFLGYSFHLFADAFTVQGIRPFWPFKGVSKGFIKSGGLTDKVIFYTLAIADLVLIAVMLFSPF